MFMMLKLNTKENLARSLAKRSAMGHKHKLTAEEMSALIEQLFACQTPEYSPDGQRCIGLLEANKIEQLLR